jgi:hypothetical protein
MQPVLRRIAIHGGITAIVLGLIGLMMAEMASVWLISSLPTRAGQNPPDTSAIRHRMPLFMAAVGFAFVACGELLLHRVRKNRNTSPPPTQLQVDETERLLQELLAKEDAKRAAAQPGVVPTSPSSENTVAPPPSTQVAEGGK